MNLFFNLFFSFAKVPPEMKAKSDLESVECDQPDESYSEPLDLSMPGEHVNSFRSFSTYFVSIIYIFILSLNSTAQGQN